MTTSKTPEDTPKKKRIPDRPFLSITSRAQQLSMSAIVSQFLSAEQFKSGTLYVSGKDLSGTIHITKTYDDDMMSLCFYSNSDSCYTGLIKSLHFREDVIPHLVGGILTPKLLIMIDIFFKHFLCEPVGEEYKTTWKCEKEYDNDYLFEI